MILTLLFYILTIFLTLITAILPTWELWPADLTNSLTFYLSTLGKFNFLLPIDTLFTIISFYIGFEVLYFTSKIVMKIFNYFRGASGIDL